MFEITAQGSKLTVTLDGTRSVDVEHGAYARGPSRFSDLHQNENTT